MLLCKTYLCQGLCLEATFSWALSRKSSAQNTFHCSLSSFHFFQPYSSITLPLLQSLCLKLVFKGKTALHFSWFWASFPAQYKLNLWFALPPFIALEEEPDFTAAAGHKAHDSLFYQRVRRPADSSLLLVHNSQHKLRHPRIGRKKQPSSGTSPLATLIPEVSSAQFSCTAAFPEPHSNTGLLDFRALGKLVKPMQGKTSSIRKNSKYNYFDKYVTFSMRALDR